MKDLEAKEIRILEYIQTAMSEHGYCPTVREICQGLNIRSTSTVHRYLNRLEEKGFIKREALKRRAIELTVKPQQEMVEVPLLGEIAAGVPIFAEEQMLDKFQFSENLTGGGSLFGLKVKGTSMKDAGILHGDIVIVRAQETAENGDIVAALLDNEATVKTFYQEKDCIRLQPENPEFEPICVQNVQILGKVITLVRRFGN